MFNRKESSKHPPVTESCEASPLIKTLIGHFIIQEHVLLNSYFEYLSGISFTSQCLKHFFLQSIWFWQVLDKWDSSELGGSVNATMSSLPDASLSNLFAGNERGIYSKCVNFCRIFFTFQSQIKMSRKYPTMVQPLILPSLTPDRESGNKWACIVQIMNVFTVPKIHTPFLPPQCSCIFSEQTNHLFKNHNIKQKMKYVTLLWSDKLKKDTSNKKKENNTMRDISPKLHSSCLCQAIVLNDMQVTAQT